MGITLDQLTNEWINLLQDRQNNEALELYCERIIPYLVPILRKKFQESYGRDHKYDGLISLLGFTPETAVLAYHFALPNIFVVLHTKESEKFLDTVGLYTKIHWGSFFHEPFNEQPSSSIYYALEAALKRFPKGSRVAIELTGGKKTMNGALAVAAGILDIDLLYIDYEIYMQEFRKPKPSSTYIHLVENPMRLPVDLFGSLVIERAVNFFNIGKYDISKELFEEAGQQMATPRVAEVFANLSRFYSCWNSFDFSEALGLSTLLFEQALKFYGQIFPRFYFDIEKLRLQISVIKILAEENRTEILWNFFFTARRYEKNGQNDIAALLYYRTIENVFENNLKDIIDGFNLSKPDYNLIQCSTEEIQDKFLSFKSQAFKENVSSRGLPDKIAMFDAFCLLGALDAPLSQRINPGRVANIAETRNLSIYAHGSRPITAQSIEKIRKLAIDVLQAYVDINQLDSIDSQRNKFEFIEIEFRKD